MCPAPDVLPTICASAQAGTGGWVARRVALVASIVAIAGCGAATGKRAGAGPAPANPAAAAGPAPQSFTIPQAGRIGFRCDSAGAVQPFYDGHGTPSEDAVTIRAGAVVRRNYTTRVVGHAHGRPLIEFRFSTPAYLALPYGDYPTVMFTIEQGTEARIIHARATVQFMPRLCLARGWTVVEAVS
jgi:hypothetical protein